MTMVIVIAGSRLKVAQKIAVPTVLMTNLESIHGQPIKVLICIAYRITSDEINEFWGNQPESRRGRQTDQNNQIDQFGIECCKILLRIYRSLFKTLKAR